MDEILKYHRVQGRIRDLLKYDKIRSADISINLIAIGTEEGNVHVLSLDNPLITSFKSHKRVVNDISLDSNGTTLASCSDDGTVMLYSLNNEEDKGTSIHFNELVKSVIVDDDNNPKKEKSIIIGTGSGKLIHHKQVWFTNKNVVLFNGNASPVTAITWRGDIVAWVDLSLVRVMNITSQSAVCYVSAPLGVGIPNPFPCNFFWETDKDLFIAWADNIRHLEITSSSKNQSQSQHKEDDRETTARTVTEYQMDCITCGISAFDAEHLIVFGYIPPEEDEMSSEDQSSHSLSVSNRPELKIIKRTNGDIISCDTLSMQGQVFQGPWDYRFLSSFMCPSKGKYSKKWHISDIQSSPSTVSSALTSSAVVSTIASSSASLLPQEKQEMSHHSISLNKGNRGLSPILILLSPEDIVIAKVRDVNDRIGIALQNGDFQLAANLAISDKTSLRHYHYHDIISLYLDDLIDSTSTSNSSHSGINTSDSDDSNNSYSSNNNNIEFAASECARLIGTDPILWDRWIHSFIKRECIASLLKYIPTSNPRLATEVYEDVLEHFFQKDSVTFLSLIELWGRIKPPLFHHENMITRLKNAPKLDPWSMEGLAQLYLWSKKYENALNSYLEINYSQVDSDTYRTRRTATEEDFLSYLNKNNPTSNTNLISNSNKLSQDSLSQILPTKSEERANFVHVFELIEKEKLYDNVRERVMNLFRLSKELSNSLLVRNVDQFPIATVVRQLKADKRLLHYYLHYLFTKYEPYNNDRQYSEFHTMQVTLYAEFAPKFEKPVTDITSYNHGSNNNDSIVSDNFVELIGLKGKNIDSDSQFLTFLRTSKFYILDYALRECEKRKPPLYHEMVYLLDLKGMRKEALNLLLKEIGDIRQAVDFIERHEDAQQLELWNDLVDYSIKNRDYLSGLLEYLGICNLNPVRVVSSIPPGIKIPALRQKILRIIKQYHFQIVLTDKCNMILEEDALDSLKRLKQGQRKAMKVNPTSRCVRCAKPVFMNPGGIGTNLFTDNLNSRYKELNYQVWGQAKNTAAVGGVVVFSPRIVFHRQCFDIMSSLKKVALNIPENI